MPIVSESRPRGEPERCSIRIAAAGDLHLGREADLARAARAFAALQGRVDLVLLAGDLSTHGEPAQAQLLVTAAREVDAPILTVLGNHDWHVDRADEFSAVLEEGGITVLSREHRIIDVNGTDVGIVGCKGFMGGFPGSHLPDFGEPLLRQVYAEGMREASALDEGLRAIDLCPFRIALLHYAPTCETLVGERREIWTFLGTDRLAPPILEHTPDLVLHGHAHHGTFEGRIGEVPVYNVSVPVMGQDFWVFEMTGARSLPSEVH